MNTIPFCVNKLRFLFVLLWLPIAALAQEPEVYSVYFQFGKSELNYRQAEEVLAKIQKLDQSRIEKLEIFGYTDDVGKADYNYKLSQDRAHSVQQFLNNKGITNEIAISITGKGQVMIEDDALDNLPEARSQNRRVDILVHLKPLPRIQLPGVYNTVQKTHVVGDRIYLENLLFERGSSVLTVKAKNELTALAKLLLKHKNLHFEIQGHVCCLHQYTNEAIDLKTKKRKLSHNRAAAVYNYLVLKKIPKDRMTFKGYGNTKPLGGEVEYDRRVEIVITKN